MASTALGKHQAVVSKEELRVRERSRKGEIMTTELREYLQHSSSLGSFYELYFKFLASVAILVKPHSSN